MVAGQSTHLYQGEQVELAKLVLASKKQDLKIYLDWGKYDFRNAANGYSWPDDNKRFAALLRKQGYTIMGGQVNDGYDWPSWRTRTDRILQLFFPVSEPD